MGFKCGIVGLPNVGKSTLFNALTQSNQANAQNFPFCTIEPNVGLVAVADNRLQQLSDLVQPQQTLPAVVEFVDIAGLVAGAAQGEGLGNKFLGHIRATNAIVQVVRCFASSEITHVSGKVDPVADIETIELELTLADLETLERALQRLGKAAKSGDKQARIDLTSAERLHAQLAAGKSLRKLTYSDDELQLLQQLQLLSAKPQLLVANVADMGEENQYSQQVRDYGEQHSSPVISICAQMEAELIGMDASAQQELLAEFGLQQSGLQQLVAAGYKLLGLQSYFTCGPKEVRAWTIRQGVSAFDAAGVIHSDFQKGFIRAEVISFTDYANSGSEAAAKASGLLRLEGKDYLVQDGDVMHFRFNV